MNNKRVGELGERLAKIYLETSGFQILKCNYRTKRGEIDIIAKKNRCIHFVEVKSRTNKYVLARQSIDKTKCDHILRVAEYYIYMNRIENVSCQIDAIEVYIQENSVQINYIPQIIEK